jgi:hypothetical protein
MISFGFRSSDEEVSLDSPQNSKIRNETIFYLLQINDSFKKKTITNFIFN